MKSTSLTGFGVTALLITWHAHGIAQGSGSLQTRVDADLNRQRAESRAVQKKNEAADKEERAQFEARKKGYEKEERRKEEKQQREVQEREKLLQTTERAGKRAAGM